MPSHGGHCQPCSDPDFWATVPGPVRPPAVLVIGLATFAVILPLLDSWDTEEPELNVQHRALYSIALLQAFPSRQATQRANRLTRSCLSPNSASIQSFGRAGSFFLALGQEGDPFADFERAAATDPPPLHASVDAGSLV